MELKDYQEEAVKKLLTRAKDLLSQEGDKKMVFQSPTGSGKTVMVAEFLKRLADGKGAPPFCVIWIAPGKLHLQSMEKLEKYYDDSMALECLNFDQLTDGKIGEYQVVFLNWESIRQENNIIIRDNERDFYFAKVLEKTKDDGLNIVLIVDESHRAAKSEIAENLVADIAPKLAVEVSATPITQSPDEIVRIPIEKPKAEAMIKKSVILNDGIENAVLGGGIKTAERADGFLLKQALARRQELAAAFTAEGANVNPLLCIQLPDRRTAQDVNIEENIYKVLNELDITVQNRKLAVYLSGEYENLGNISHNNNESEVMIFKQAIALGWDCPRAHILVLFRNWRDNTFSVQTLGRIMRMPEPETGHYQNEMLNNAFVYTNKEEVHIGQDVAGGYLRIFVAERSQQYNLLKLSSVHRLRQREKTRLSPLFNKLFLAAADKYQLQEKINTRDQTVAGTLISDRQTGNIDEWAGTDITGDVDINIENEEDLQKLFDYFARDNLSPYYPDDRSIGRVKTAIYDFFGGSLQMDYAEDFEKIVNIVLSEKNSEHFSRVLIDAKNAYKAETEKRSEPLQITAVWEVAEKIDYSENYAAREAKKSVMQPFFAANRESAPEKEFIKLLEKSDNVQWWHKNGAGESMYFAVPYTENGEEKPFYPDFIVRFTDGKIGIYETKSGIMLATAKNKSDGLLAYIAKHKDNKLIGGIVAPTDARNYSRGWKIYAGKGEDINPANLSNWNRLEI